MVSAVIVMQADVGGSLKASWSCLIGTAIGALFGTVALAFLAQMLDL
ncbi:MAG TPA: FUSC family protein [Trichocoleus sp.]